MSFNKPQCVCMCVCDNTYGKSSQVYFIFVNSSKLDYKQALLTTTRPSLWVFMEEKIMAGDREI